MAGCDRPFGLREPLGPWRPLDSWVAGYTLLATGVLGLGAARGLAGCRNQALANLLVLAGILALARWSRDARGLLPVCLRLVYPVLLFALLYHQVQTLWPVLHRAPLDGALAALELRLWGTQPSLAFQAALPGRGWSELFCCAYFAYYLGVPAVILTALFARGYELAERVTLATTACFCSCYTLFWLLPTVGPHYWFAPALGPGPYRGYVFNQLLHAITSRGEIRGGACPSSHLAVALLLTLWARRAAPRLFPVLAVITALLVPAVVYLRAHYLVDVPAGLAAGLLAYGLSARGSFSDRKTK